MKNTRKNGYALVLLTSATLQKACQLTLIEYPRKDDVIKSFGCSFMTDMSYPLHRFSSLECNIGPDSASGLCGMSYCVSSAFSLSLMSSAVQGGFVAVVAIYGYKCVPFNDFLCFSLIACCADGSIRPGPFYGGEATSTSSRFIAATSCANFLFRL